MAHAWQMHPQLQSGDVLLADRGFIKSSVVARDGPRDGKRQWQKTLGLPPQSGRLLCPPSGKRHGHAHPESTGGGHPAE